MSGLWTVTGCGGCAVSVEERLELVGEVKSGEDRERVLSELVETLKGQLAYQKSYSQLLYSQLEKSHGEGDGLRAQLAIWSARRTTGGFPRGTTPDWSPNGKVSEMPPPYSPAIETGKVES